MPSYRMPNPPTYEHILREGQALKGENVSRAQPLSTSIVVDGTVYGMLLPFRAGDIVTNIHLFVSVLAADCTVSLVGLYNTSNAKLAESADLGTAWHTTGTKTHALTAPFTIPTTGVYRVALLSKATTTLPTFLRGSNSGVSTSPSGGALLAVTMASQTSLPTTLTPAAGAICFWVGWS